jgi:predicted transcriptional regulator
MSRDKANILADSGMRHYEAKTLLFLFSHGSGYSRDIEREMDLRQPEVSASMSVFIEKKWVNKKPVDAQGKGRPSIFYSLQKEKKQIIEELKNKVNDDMKNKLELLRELDTI